MCFQTANIMLQNTSKINSYHNLDRSIQRKKKFLLRPKRRILYRVIHKSLRDFRTRLRNNQDRHGRKEHINR